MQIYSILMKQKLYTVDRPDVIIIAAAKVGNANNTKRVEFLIENLKINTNILESIIDKNNIK